MDGSVGKLELLMRTRDEDDTIVFKRRPVPFMAAPATIDHLMRINRDIMMKEVTARAESEYATLSSLASHIDHLHKELRELLPLWEERKGNSFSTCFTRQDKQGFCYRRMEHRRTKMHGVLHDPSRPSSHLVGLVGELR
jgi:hypothetical protein